MSNKVLMNEDGDWCAVLEEDAPTEEAAIEQVRAALLEWNYGNFKSEDFDPVLRGFTQSPDIEDIELRETTLDNPNKLGNWWTFSDLPYED